jgi:hypothetical protein
MSYISGLPLKRLRPWVLLFLLCNRMKHGTLEMTEGWRMVKHSCETGRWAIIRLL